MTERATGTERKLINQAAEVATAEKIQANDAAYATKTPKLVEIEEMDGLPIDVAPADNSVAGYKIATANEMIL